MSLPFERDGHRELLPITALQNLSWHDPDESVRQRAYEAELAGWETVREPLAACLNGVKGAGHTLNRRTAAPARWTRRSISRGSTAPSWTPC